MAGVVIDKEAWPLVVVTFPSDSLSDDEVNEYMAELQAILKRGEVYGMITNVAALQDPMSSHHRQLLDTWHEENREQIGEFNAGNAVVSSMSPMERGELAGYYREQNPPNPHRVVGTFGEAVRWVSSQLKKRGADPPNPPASDVPMVTPIPASVARDEEQAISAASYGDAALILDLFDQPAFLVTAGGDLLHANGAAAGSFKKPPLWLRRAVSSRPGPLASLCRLGTLATAEGVVFVVVPDAQLVPPPDAEDRQGFELEGGLLEVAESIARGLSDQEIAVDAGVSIETVQSHAELIIRELGVKNRAELIALWAGRTS